MTNLLESVAMGATLIDLLLSPLSLAFSRILISSLNQPFYCHCCQIVVFLLFPKNRRYFFSVREKMAFADANETAALSLSLSLSHTHTHTLSLFLPLAFVETDFRDSRPNQFLASRNRFDSFLTDPSFSPTDFCVEINRLISDLNILNQGPWWWWLSSGQRPRLLLGQTEFESCKLLKQFSVKKNKKMEKAWGLGHLKSNILDQN